MAGILVVLLPRLITYLHAITRTYKIVEVSPHKVAIVFGAGLWRDGTPTPVLRDRVKTASKLYFAGKTEKILLSGDNSSEYYDEPSAMKKYAISLGIPEEAIVLDYAGRRTYDTCYRAKHIFGINKAILITQSFHLPRALYTCNSLGVNSIGVPSNLRTYRKSSLFYWNLREIPATFVAMLDLHINKPIPILGDPEPIFPEKAQ